MPQDRPKSIFGGFGALLEAPWDDFRDTYLVPDLDQDHDPETDPDPDPASDPDPETDQCFWSNLKVEFLDQIS